MPSRRDMMTGGAALAAASLLYPSMASARNQAEIALLERTGGAGVNPGRVTLSIPRIAESGLAVFATVDVESAMTADDHVKTIHLLSEKNPIAQIATFRFGPRAGRARVSTSIRLAASQRVIALAEMSDGSFWADEKSVIVTIAACTDGG